MDPTLLLLILLMPAALLVVAFCSASEAAFFSLTRTDQIRIRRQWPAAGAAAHRILRHPRRLVLSVLLVTNAASVVFYVVATMLERRIENKLLSVGVNVSLLLLMVLAADLLPKLLASASPVRLVSVLAIPLDGVVRVVGPIVRFFDGFLVAPLIRLIRSGASSSSGHSAAVTEAELGVLLELSAGSGEIERDEQRLLTDVIRLGSIRVRDVMVPRIAMPWVTDRFTSQDVVRILKRSPFLRIPVFRGSPEGDPVGWLEAWKYLAAAESASESRGAGHAPPNVESFLTPVTIVPERAKLDQFIELLRSNGTEQALCVNEYGSVVGMISIQEVIRELSAGTGGLDGAGRGGAAEIERRSENCWVIPGRLPARELASLLGISSTRGGQVSTVAGLLIQQLGRVPAVGDAIRLGNVELRVESVAGRAISTVALTLLDQGPAEGRAGSGSNAPHGGPDVPA